MATYVITIDDDVDPGIVAINRAVLECVEPRSTEDAIYDGREWRTGDRVKMHPRLGVKVRHIVT